MKQAKRLVANIFAINLCLLYKERRKMPAISKFLGIVIMMYYDEYNPPHFHAKYQEQEGIFSLEGEIIDSDLPLKQRRLVSE